MPTLTLTFLGHFRVWLDGRPVVAFETDKVRALLAYLAVEADHNHSRSELASLLWPGYTEGSARTTLRHVLHQLRQTIQDATASPPFLLITRQTIQFNTMASYTLDTELFSRLLHQVSTHPHQQLARCPECLQALQQAVDLYDADFLLGLTIQDSTPFEEWRRIRQEYFHVAGMEALHQLTAAYAARGDDELVRIYAQRQIALEPWREEAHRHLMIALAHLGQRNAAIAQYHICRQILAAELGVEPDVAITTIYEELRRGLFVNKRSSEESSKWEEQHDTPVHTTALPRSSSPPLILPMPLTPCIGRQRELTSIIAQLQKVETRLLTLVGPGGIGKTRLAIETARMLAEQATQERKIQDTIQTPQTAALDSSLFPDGVYFIGLAALSNAAALVPAIAAVLALPLTDSDPEQQLLNFLRTRRLLLILDNFEHLLEGTALTVQILEVAPGVKLLVTSRERLNIQGEYVYPVHGMHYRLDDPLHDAAVSPAVQLFVQWAQRTQTDFQLNENNLSSVLRICQLVDGMPLGLALAAAWVEMLSLPEIAAEIEKNTDFLTVDWRDVPDRHRSMRAVFTWSWQLLTFEEQQAYARLALFRGGFTREAAEQVAGASLGVLKSLSHRSLLHRVATGETVPARYEIHELLRQFAAEGLAVEERHAIEARHTAYYLAFVAAKEHRLARTEPREAAAEIQVDIDNIRLAWSRAAKQLDVEALSQSAWALRLFYDITGMLAEGIEAFHLIAEHISILMQPSVELIQEWLHHLRPVSKLGAIYANLLVMQGKHIQAISSAQQAIAIAEVCGASEVMALAHLSWGQALYRQGNYSEAESYFEQTMQQVQQAHAYGIESEMLYDVACTAQLSLGAVATEKGEMQIAREKMGQGLHLAQRLGKRRMEITCLTNLANLARNTGDYTAARQGYEYALQRISQIGYVRGEVNCLLELGDVLRLQGEYSRATEFIQRALTLFHEMQAHSMESIAFTWLGRIYSYLGDYNQADQWLSRYLHTSHEKPWLEAEIHYCHACGMLALHRCDPTQALAYVTQAYQLTQTLVSTAHVYTLVLMGHAQTHLHYFEKATTAYQEAMHLAAQIDRADMSAEAQAGLANITYRQHHWSHALRLVEALLSPLSEGKTVGIDEPFYVYLVVFQVLAANHDPRAAFVLQRAYELLQQYASHITDPILRQSFLEDVPIHQALHAAYMKASNKLELSHI